MAKSHHKETSGSNTKRQLESVPPSNASRSNDRLTGLEPPDLETPELANGDLGKIQEILFGDQMLSHSKQLSSLHTYVEQQLAALQSSCQQQFSELQRKLDEGLSGLNQEVQQNTEKQSERLATVSGNLDRSEAKLLQSLNSASEQSGKVQSQLQSRIDESSERLNESMRSSREEILQRLESAIAELQSQKLDRGALSGLLGEVAVQLSGQAAETKSAPDQ